MASSSWAVVVGLGALLGFFLNPEAPYPRALPIKSVPAKNHATIYPIGEGAVDISSIAERWFARETFGAETMAEGPDGEVYIPDAFGNIKRTKRKGKGPLEDWAYTGGRPLGITFDKRGSLLIADAVQGLLRVDPKSKEVTILTKRVSPGTPGEAAGSPITFANGVVVASDGTVYFTDTVDVPPLPPAKIGGAWDIRASAFFALDAGSVSGRLLKYDPRTGRTSVLASGFWFMNGLALAPDESYITFAETLATRLHRFWLKGPKAGSVEGFGQPLPGLPDNISPSADGHFWLAIPAVPSSRAAFELLGKSALLRTFYCRIMNVLPRPLARALQKQIAPPQGLVLKISSADGSVLQTLRDPTGKTFESVTSVLESRGRLFLGSLDEPFVPVVNLGRFSVW